MKPRRKSEDFAQVDKALKTMTVSQCSRETGIPDQTIRNWVDWGWVRGPAMVGNGRPRGRQIMTPTAAEMTASIDEHLSTPAVYVPAGFSLDVSATPPQRPPLVEIRISVDDLTRRKNHPFGGVSGEWAQDFCERIEEHAAADKRNIRVEIGAETVIDDDDPMRDAVQTMRGNGDSLDTIATTASLSISEVVRLCDLPPRITLPTLLGWMDRAAVQS